MSFLPFNPNHGQEELIDLLGEFMVSGQERRCLLLRGYAGTGKTSMVGAFVKTLFKLHVPCMLMAPTGRAAKVMSRYSGIEASTIHKAIYREDPSTGQFCLGPNPLKRGIIIVDEASMLASTRDRGEDSFGSGCLMDDLMRWVYSTPRCYLMVVGDDWQLPPVGERASNALRADYLAGYGLNVMQHTLREVVRQAADSSILTNATAIRAGKEECVFAPDFVRLQPNEVAESVERSYSEVGMDETLILTRSNKRTHLYNQGVRAQILWKEDELSAGDRVMVIRNNYQEETNETTGEKYLTFLANGEMLEIKRLRNEREIYGYRFVDAEMMGIDQQYEISRTICLDSLSTNTAADLNQIMKDLQERIAEDYPEVRSKQKLRELIQANPYYSALMVHYAYAITCHKAQGGQWKHVYIDIPGKAVSETQTISDEEYNRWLYTAVTRATERIYWVETQKDEKNEKN